MFVRSKNGGVRMRSSHTYFHTQPFHPEAVNGLSTSPSVPRLSNWLAITKRRSMRVRKV